MQQIQIEGIGLLNEEQIQNLLINARKYRAENLILKEELASLKEVRT